MPPFSGKKKKEQLQAKRQRKRDEEVRAEALDREREMLREELVDRGEDVTDDLLDAYMHERHPQHREPAHGRRAHRREREQRAAKKDGTDKSDDDRGNGDDGSDGDGNGAGSSHVRHPDTQMYSADRHHGVRSVFAKESPAVLAARKQLSYQPIPFRTTMPATGIPFGEWFTFPSAAAPSVRDSTERENDDVTDAARRAAEKAALVAAEQERRLDRPLVATTAEALGGGSGSVVVPFAVELPSRGWRLRPDGGLGAGEVVVASDVLTAPAGLVAEADSSPAAVALSQEQRDVKAQVKDKPHPSIRGSSGSRGGEGNNDDDDNDDDDDDDDESSSVASRSPANEATTNPVRLECQQADPAVIKGIEQKRFDTYVRCLDAYPLPEAIAGLDISSYERNLEVWQQLWRTVELSDVLVIVADARYPILHAHLGLLTYITKEQRKPCVFVLNKEDLVPASTLRCWQQFLHRYLTDLGFSVEAPDTADSEANADGGAAETVGRIALRTFTANPRPETAGQRDNDVDVTRRQKHRKGTDAKMYEKLRSGKLNATKHLGKGRSNSSSSSNSGSSDSDEDSTNEETEEEDDLRYSANENFIGMQAAEHALQHDRRAYKELAVVAQKITELLAVCRRLGAHCRAARGDVSLAATTTTPATTAAAQETECYATSSLPCPAPRAARKNKKTQKRSGTRRGKNKPAGSRDDARAGGDDDDDDDGGDAVEDRAPDSPSYIHIGFIGHPNVGKSSLLNCIRGTKVVSVSATPGHTKHIQTIPVPEEHLTLVDSPGLALPVFGVPRPLQAVLGTHQIAQTRDPQSGVSFLAAYLPIEKLYGLQRPDYAMKEEEWSSYELCEAYAKKRGYYVKHGKGALDIHRAAIAFLQEAYEGRLTLFYAPPELNLLQSAWYRERIRPRLLLTVFGPSLV